MGKRSQALRRRVEFWGACVGHGMTWVREIWGWVVVAVLIGGVSTAGWIVWRAPGWAVVLIWAVLLVVVLMEGAYRHHQAHVAAPVRGAANPHELAPSSADSARYLFSDTGKVEVEIRHPVWRGGGVTLATLEPPENSSPPTEGEDTPPARK